MQPDRDSDTTVQRQAGAELSGAAFDYLLAEFHTAWRHLGGLEDKRLRLFIGYCVFATADLLGTLALMMQPVASTQASALVLAIRWLPPIWLLLISLAFRQVSISERKATERYRNKINLVRSTLLDGLNSERLLIMQREGNDNALQIQANQGKDLRVMDVFDQRRWTTALFMKLVYDLGVIVGVLMCGALAAAA